MTLDSYETEQIAKSPEALTVLIDYHDMQATMGEAMGYDCSFHDNRMVELSALRLEAEAARAAREAGL